MSLLRLPGIILAMISLHVTTTAPHGPAFAEETLAPTRMEAWLRYRIGPSTVKAISLFAASGETSFIVASKTSHFRVSRKILSILAVNGSERWMRASAVFVIGTFMACLGGYIRYMCYRELGDLFTFELSIRKGHRLVTTGPYSWVRHPGYLGVSLCVLGYVILHAGSGSWIRESGLLSTPVGKAIATVYLTLIVSITFGLLGRMTREDQILREKFGYEWDDWAERVPCRLVPGLY